MNLVGVFCLNESCPDKHERGAGNLVSHGKKRARYRCKTCNRTLTYRCGTLFMGLHYPAETVMLVVTLVSYGCSLAPIVAAFELDERTVAGWLQRASHHA